MSTKKVQPTPAFLSPRTFVSEYQLTNRDREIVNALTDEYANMWTGWSTSPIAKTPRKSNRKTKKKKKAKKVAHISRKSWPASKKKKKAKRVARTSTKSRSAPKKKKKASRRYSSRSRPNPAFMKPLTPSASLGAVIGTSAMPRTEVTKKIWGYIKRNSLQDKKNTRLINVDDKLKPVFGRKRQVSLFEMVKMVNRNLK